jgi:uncharacterized protein YbjT (DUF2867 family)
MHFLVLGGTGFIGSHVVDALLKEGHSVKVLDRTIKHTTNKFPHLVEYIQADFGDSLVILEALTGIDAVIHLVSSTVPGTSNLQIFNQTLLTQLSFLWRCIKRMCSELFIFHPVAQYMVTL